MKSNEAELEFIVKSKESYRKFSRSQTWEEKVAAIERMRNAGAIARQSMKNSRKSDELLNNH